MQYIGFFLKYKLIENMLKGKRFGEIKFSQIWYKWIIEFEKPGKSSGKCTASEILDK